MKRLLAFALLLVGGFALLLWLAGDTATPAAPNLTGGDRPRSTPQQPGGVTVQQGPLGATFTQSGPLELVRWRAIPEADGRVRKEEVFVLKAADSRPLGEGRQQLDGVTVKLFDGAEHAATLVARQAFVALQPDANGKPSVDEGKDIDLRGVVLTAEPGSRVSGFRLELGAASVRIEEKAIALTAPDDEPVLAELAGERPFTLRGKGLTASLPRDAKGGLQRVEVVVPREPAITGDGATVRARGALRFVDDAATATAEVTLQDGVELVAERGDVALPGAAKGAAGSLRATGDRFVGSLLRHKDGGRQKLAWRRLELAGAPAIVVLPGGELTTPRLTAHADVFGELAWITAHGGESQLRQTAPRRGRPADDLLVGVSEKRIHFAEPRHVAGAPLRSFGFPRWTMRPLEQLQAVVVEGRATVRDATTMGTAQDGARLYRRDGSDAGIVRGLGPVRVTQRAARAAGPDLEATGSDGFTLVSLPGELRARFGPEAGDGAADGAWTRHAFALRHGTATANGSGVATLVQRGDDVEVDVLAAGDSLAIALPDDGLLLQRVHRIQARFVGERPVAIDAAGWPVDVDLARGGDRIAARAPRLLQTGPASLRLLPADPARAALWSGLPAADRLPTLRRATGVAAGKGDGAQDLVVRGPSIDVHHAGGRSVLVDAVGVGDDVPQAHARLQTRPGQELTTLACTAQRLRLLPFAAPPAFGERLLGGEDALASTLLRGAASPWLVVDDVRDFQLDDPRQGHVEGRGRRLLVSQGGRAAVFFGDPDALVAAEVTRVHEGRTTTLRGARVRVVDDVEVRLDALGAFPDRDAFLPPTLALHEAKRTGLLAHMQATCQGDIAVRSDEVGFGGPVAARGLLPDGRLDPAGMAIDARALRLQRSRETGEIVRAVADDVALDWSEAQARCASLDLDLRWNRLVAADPRDALVTMRDGRELRSPRIEVNYATQSVRMSTGRMSQRAAAEAKR
jgi:hypothetical protein